MRVPSPHTFSFLLNTSLSLSLCLSSAFSHNFSKTKTQPLLGDPLLGDRRPTQRPATHPATSDQRPAKKFTATHPATSDPRRKPSEPKFTATHELSSDDPRTELRRPTVRRAPIGQLHFSNKTQLYTRSPAKPNLQQAPI